jgi:hypothetical protein
MQTRQFLISGIIATFISLAGCGSNPAPANQSAGAASAKAEVKSPTLYTAKPCFNNMLGLAQRWSPDALPFHMESQLTTEATGQNGTSTVWSAMFASQSRGTMKSFTCSGSRLSSAPAAGFTSSAESAYPSNVPALLFHPSYLQNDSDKAFATSLEHGGAALIKKNPNQAILYLLDWDARKRELVWTVIYGTSQAEREGLCIINATSGAFITGGR